ncbi:hypothetical protein QTN47_18285 [Danxiaibacter flavus]|uniref:Uncharacterized protein n=1 Tax=Danxiaibacter flavus TaxID=3049108 RepID=A0ABV3ZHT5_9BACT|nr:hypothetical protein QNM32_18295 [Chitinophagaceae bacterium DXS]
MKKLLAALLMTGIVSTSFAAFNGHAAPHYGGRTVIVHGGFGYAPYYYYPYAGFGLYSPFYWNQPYYYNRPSKLDMQIADIRNDYADKIKSVRMDNTLSGKERRQMIRNFRNDRENAIDQAKRNYYKS